MGILDSVVGALGEQAGGGLADLMKGQGGVGGLVEKFAAKGLGDVAASWVGKGGNLPISPEQIASVIGHGPIADFASRSASRRNRLPRPFRACCRKPSTA